MSASLFDRALAGNGILNEFEREVRATCSLIVWGIDQSEVLKRLAWRHTDYGSNGKSHGFPADRGSWFIYADYPDGQPFQFTISFRADSSGVFTYNQKNEVVFEGDKIEIIPMLHRNLPVLKAGVSGFFPKFNKKLWALAGLTELPGG